MKTNTQCFMKTVHFFDNAMRIQTSGMEKI